MIEETKNILERVSQLYHKYGIKSVTMDDVSRELGISKKTIYMHFSDKEELVGNVIDFMIETRHNCMNEIYEKELNAIDELFEVARQVNQMLREHNPAMEYDLKKYYPAAYEKVKQVKRKVMYDSVMNNLQKGIRQGIYRSEMNPDVIAKMHVARVEGMIESDVFTEEEFTRMDYFREIMIYHLRGIANEKGIKILEKKLLMNQL